MSGRAIGDLLSFIDEFLKENVDLGLEAYTIAELSILISFLCFLAIIIKKVWPLVINSLDSHIEKVKTEISSAENLKEKSATALTRASQISSRVQSEVEDCKKKSEERIAQLKGESEQYLQKLREKSEKSLHDQLNAELAKQKEQLLARLADLVVDRLSEKVKDQVFDVNISQEDLKKLIQ